VNEDKLRILLLCVATHTHLHTYIVGV